MERNEKDTIAKRSYVGECGDSYSMGKPRKRLIDTVKECLKKKDLDVSEQGEWFRIGVNGGSL